MTDKELEGRTESMLFFFFQMPNVKYAIASSVYYMSLILTYLLAKKIETIFRLRDASEKN